MFGGKGGDRRKRDARAFVKRVADRKSAGIDEADDVAGRFRVINERRTQSGGVAGGTLR